VKLLSSTEKYSKTLDCGKTFLGADQPKALAEETNPVRPVFLLITNG
jgi:hypothetical protein